MNLTEFREKQKQSYLAWKRTCFSLVDSGANEHMVNNIDMLVDYQAFDQDRMTNTAWVTVGDGDQVEALGMGTLIIEGEGKQLVLREVLYVPELYCNVISVSSLTEQDDLSVVFSKFGAEVKAYEGASEVLLKAVKTDGLYLVDLARNKCKWSTPSMHSAYRASAEHASFFSAQGSATPSSCVSNVCEHNSMNSNAYTWHCRLGHPSQQMTKGLCESVEGIPAFTELSASFKVPCHDCLAGRFTAAPRKKAADRPTQKCELVYADLVGPYIKGLNSSTMCLNVIDAFTGFAISTPLREKGDACKALTDSLKRLQMISHTRVLSLRTDNDKVFHSKELLGWLADHLIDIEHSAPYIHKQVGTIERFNRTLLETTRSLLSQGGRSKTLWPEAMLHACYLYNRRPSVHSPLTHYEQMTGSKPDLSKLRVWGCKAMSMCPGPAEEQA